MAVFKCKMCGGNLEITGESSVVTCEYCGTQQTLPKLDDDKIARLYNRANEYRLNNEFDKAYGAYEAIISEKEDEPEAYWGLVLCNYGIEYVDDTLTNKKIPTCHRSSFENVFDNINFKKVLEFTDADAIDIYISEAKKIEALRKNIVEVSSREDPYDIFICYKETDENGDRTVDSVIAQDVYSQLTEKGYRVFFSRITLEDKLGTQYEPYIFAAINSAKVMLVFGSSNDYYNAVWVKNEWSRFLQLIFKGDQKVLIPCYKSMTADQMPKEFVALQAQDMGKVGATQDLIRGIEKIIPISNKKQIGEKTKVESEPEKIKAKKPIKKSFFVIPIIAVLVVALIVISVGLPMFLKDNGSNQEKIDSITETDTKKVAVISGHSNNSYTAAYSDLLVSNNYIITEISDKLISEIPSEYDAIIISAPTTDFIGSELDVISEFLDNGGKLNKGLIFFADAASPYLPNLYTFLKQWGISIEEGIIFETNSENAYAKIKTTLGTFPVVFEDDDITKNIGQGAITDYNVPMKVCEPATTTRKATALMQTTDTTIIAPFGITAEWTPSDSDTKQQFDTVIQSVETDYDSNNNKVNSYVMAFASVEYIQSTWASYSELCNQNIVMACTNRATHIADTDIDFPHKVLGAEE